MKKLISALLICALAGTMLVACTEEGGETDVTTTVTTTKSFVRDPEDPEDPGDELPDDKEILTAGDAEYKYVSVEVTWTSNDYVTRDIDGFGAFVAENPNWMATDYDDSAWDSATGPLGDRINPLGDGNSPYWGGNNKGLFVRTTFTLTQEDMDELKKDGTEFYLECFYDNSIHLYINGTEVFAHDDSDLFQEGVPGNDGSLGVHDWVDGYDFFYLDGGDTHQVYEGDITDILVVGENVIAASLIDCWGGREFDIGVGIAYLG